MILAIDLGGTSAKVGIFKERELLKFWNIKTVKKNLFLNIKNKIKINDYSEIEKIGLSAPGILDMDQGRIVLSTNLNLKNFDVKKEIKKIFNKDCFLINDGKAAHLGEFWMQNKRLKDKTSIMYTIGTGIVGSIMIKGKIIFGDFGIAGEMGHGGNFRTNFDCSCLLKNCVESQSSAIAIEKMIYKIYGEKITLKDLPNKIRNSSKFRLLLIDSLRPLGEHIAIMMSALNPSIVIIGGGASNLDKLLIDSLWKTVKNVQLKLIYKNTKIETSTLKGLSGMYGAAFWAIKKDSIIL